MLSQEVFDYLPEGGCLVEDACATLAGEGKLFGYKYDGFWKPADTFKERAELDARYNNGDRPWMVWEHAARRRRRGLMISLFTGDIDEIAVVGAHCDDIAIGMGGTLLTSCGRESWPDASTPWCWPAVVPSAKVRSGRHSPRSVLVPTSH